MASKKPRRSDEVLALWEERARQYEEEAGDSETVTDDTDADVSALPVQLDFWPSSQRGVPNEIVRSALFNVGNPNRKRRYCESEAVVVLGDGKITYRGEELRQDDEDVWLQILHFARPHPLGEWVVFAPIEVLRALGWARTKFYYDKLRTILERLQATTVTLWSKRLAKTVSISLVRRFDTEGGPGKRKRWRVWLEPEIRDLFGKVYYTKLIWAQRSSLSSPIAKWLHGLYSSHAEPYPLKVETLRAGSGSRAGNLFHFREDLSKALDELVRVGFLEAWRIDDKDKVHVKRAPRIRPKVECDQGA